MARFSLFGVPVGVHFSFLLIAFLVAGSARNSDLGVVQATVAATVGIFLSVLLHEAGHAFAARFYGAEEVSITLFALGGLDDWMVVESVAETADGADHADETAKAGTGVVARFAGAGPFHHWRRTVSTSSDGDRLIEMVEFRLATPGLATPFGWLFAWALRRPLDRRDRAPFWAPPQRFDATGAQVFTLLVVATMAAAYLGTLLSQTITFVADDFGADRSTQGLVTGLTRIGALLSLAVVAMADRAGRRRMLIAAGIGSAVFASVAALSPSIWFFGGAQLASRGLATGFGILIGIFAAEESPAGSRAWITSILALFAGLGSGMVLWLVPLADAGEGNWRYLFVIALLAVPVVWALGRRLPESRRFIAHDRNDAVPAPITATMRKRFGLLAIVSFATAMFAAPSSNFQNEYLRDERGFSGARISLFSSVTSTPIGIGVAIFGPMADRRGRRVIGAIGIIGGVVFNVVRYGFGGPLMWIAGTASTIIGAAAIPALGVYGPEMFPTSRRGLANGLLTCVSVVGSMLGLALVGWLSERWSFGSTFALVAVVPLAAVLVLRWYPETARRALEELNPEDAAPGP